MLKVVLVDDEQEILHGLQRLIDWGSLGYEIAFATTNPVEAMAKIEAIQPDVVVTDIRMPVYSGLALISELAQRAPRARAIILSGYDDFAFVKEALQLGVFNYLLKPVDEEELSSSLLAIRSRIENDDADALRAKDTVPLLHRLIHAPVVTGQEEQAALKSLQRHSPFRLLLLSPALDRATERHVFLDAIHQYLLRYGTALALDFSNDAFLLYTGPLPSPYELSEQCKKANLTTGSQTAVLYSPPFTDLTTLSRWAKALRARAESDTFFCRRQALLLLASADGPGPSNLKEWMPFERDVFQQLEAAVKGLRFSDIPKLLDSLQSTLSSETFSIKPEEARMVFRDFMSCLKLYLSGIDSASLSAENLSSIVLRLDDARNIEQLTADCKAAVLGIFQDVLPHGNNGKASIRQIELYIQLHLDEDLSVKRLASTFYMSGSYLSTLFVKETGQPISAYVNNLRLNKAAQMLVETDSQILDISAATGFSSPKTFFKQFKSLFGCTPMQYRKQKKA